MVDDFLGVLHANPWVESLVDLPELNSAASSAIEKEALAVRERARTSPTELRSSSKVLLGPPGTGKTHLFARVRKVLGPRAALVHLRPLLHPGLSPVYVLGETLQALDRVSYGRAESQVDALVGSLIGHLEGHSVDFPTSHLSAFRELDEAARSHRLEELEERLFAIFPDLDDIFLERLLSLPFVAPRQRRALLAWLSGQDCDPSQLSRIGASSSLDPRNAVRALRTLSSVAALGAPLILVFDQLENLIQRDGLEERVTQYGNLIAELVDSTRGLIVVQMALDSEWEQGILPRLNLSQRSRVSMHKSAVSLPTPEQARALLELWCAQLEEPQAPFPWPFSAEQVRKLTTLPGVTPRMLLSAMREAREGIPLSILGFEESGEQAVPADQQDLSSVLCEEWRAHLVAAHHQIDQAEARRGGVDCGRLCDGILLAAELEPGVVLRGCSDRYIQLEPKSPGGRWVSYLHQAHHQSIGAALDRILGRDSTEPGVVLREQWRPFSPSWRATQEKRREVELRPHLIWHELSREEAAFLLALEDILQAARSRDICDSAGRPLSEEQVRSHLRDEVRPQDWQVMKALRAASAGDSISPPEEAVRDDSVLSDARSLDDEAKTVQRVPDKQISEETTTLQGVLIRLRVASVDRIIRETHRLTPMQGRKSVLDGLQDMGDQVIWFGRNIVAWRGES